MNYERPELIDHLAREYALGTLQGPARRRLLALMRDSRQIAAAVAQWEARLAVMERAQKPIPPPASTWRAIEQRLFPDTRAAASKAGTGDAGVVGGVRRWLSARVLGGVVAGMLAAVVVIKTAPTIAGLEAPSEALPASYVGVLGAPSAPPSVVVSSRRHGKLLTVKVLRPIDVPAGRQATLWAIPKEGVPWVVGTVTASGQTRIALPQESEKLFAAVGRLGISLEAPAAAPPAAPSAFVLEGACVKVW
ncbi:anti-sigma factor [Mitsuaria sp. GD03876]|uniref:anti-sigma factor n=1 Tax=Mitsuaria sp. GD03876 TaxID=2975399 RepID=UPI0024496173|nr:anti-sigma factor [Mitsuaria sp. GD03876]MDH0865878.1 anti-sigma factor [Mitsuaria sp. GD03876]